MFGVCIWIISFAYFCCASLSNKTIIVNNGGNESDACCGFGECECSSLYLALQKTSDTAGVNINITSDMVRLEVIPVVATMNYIMISGTGVAKSNGVIVMCNGTGGIHFDRIDNVLLESIVWDRCGNPLRSDLGGGIHVTMVTLMVKNCIFQNSQIRALYISFAAAHIYSSSFINNEGGGLYVSYCDLFTLGGNVLFENNSASRGAGILSANRTYTSWINATISFLGNKAEIYGGAIFVDLDLPCYQTHGFFRDVINSTVSFDSNEANTGNSFYFGLQLGCNIYPLLLKYPLQFHYSRPIDEEIGTTVYRLRVFSPAVCVNDSLTNDCTISEIMLGQEVIIPASVVGFFGNIAEPSQFFITCFHNCADYTLSGKNFVLVDVDYLRGFWITGKPPSHSIMVGLKFTLVRSNSLIDIELLSLNLNISLSSCFTGFDYSTTLNMCKCYDHQDDIVRCTGVNATIKQGYWFGYVEELATVTPCPNSYCDFSSCDTCVGYCNLSRVQDDQCRRHRTGPACGNCKSGYVLPFDSVDCINMNKCSAGITFVVVFLSIIYWFAVVVVLLILLNLSFEVGYAYAIIYFYSVVDLLYDYIPHKSLYQFVKILSGFAQLTPNFLGTLCFTDSSEWSEIDQQFFHYVHPFSVSLILLLLIISARHSPKLSRYIRHSIIRAICLILLLAYTSLASTSLELLRPLVYTDVKGVYTYSSPDKRYFHGRHAVYACVAIIVELIIVIGFPAVLLFEPILKRKISFFKIKPLLDQFQGCYKDKCHSFAAFYLLCRLAILIVVYTEENYYNRLFLLQVLCFIITLIHGCTLPYRSKVLNVLDLIILIVAVFLVNFNTSFSFTSFQSSDVGVLFTIVLLPLITFIAVVVFSGLQYVTSKRRNEQENEYDENSVLWPRLDDKN